MIADRHDSLQQFARNCRKYGASVRHLLTADQLAEVAAEVQRSAAPLTPEPRPIPFAVLHRSFDV